MEPEYMEPEYIEKEQQHPPLFGHAVNVSKYLWPFCIILAEKGISECMDSEEYVMFSQLIVDEKSLSISAECSQLTDAELLQMSPEFYYSHLRLLVFDDFGQLMYTLRMLFKAFNRQNTQASIILNRAITIMENYNGDVLENFDIHL